MSDESDDAGGGTLVHGPWSGDSTYTLPPIPDFIDTIPPPEEIPAAPPETPAETTMELPPIPVAPNPALALRSEGTAAPETCGDGGEYEAGEYEQSRSLADRLGDWLEFRLEMARSNHESEAPFREAEIARKAALLEGRTAQEVAMMEQNGKLHAAMMKAKGDKAVARGKADADRTKSSSSGLGADKGRSKAGGGGGSPRGGGGTGASRTNSGAGPNRPGSSRGSNSGGPGGRSGSGATGGGGGGKGGVKGSERGSGGRAAGSGRNGSSGGSKGSQAGSGSSGRGGDSKGERGPASSARAERARGRQDRAGTRQAGRQERRTAGHAAGVADRSKDRDQARAQKQQAWEDRRAKKAKRAEARKAKREAAASADPGRTTLGQAVGEEAQRRWDKRRADAKAAADAKDTKAAGTEKVDLTKDKDKTKGADGKDADTGKDAPDGASSAAKDGTAGDAPGTGSTAGDGASGGAKKRRRFRFRRAAGTGRAGRRGRTSRTGRTGRTGRGRTGRAGRRGRPADSPFGAEDSTPTVEWPEHDTRPPERPAKSEDDIVDADIVPDTPAAVTTGARGLPPAPDKHTARPGTTRPTSTEGSSMGSAEVSRPSGGGGLATQHRTDITFDEYLVEMANIAIKAASDQERAEALMEALGKVAEALREMAADLVGDHNIDTAVTDLIAYLADSAARMKSQAERCAEQCGIAKEAAKLAATMVARVYGEDMAAKEDAGLKHASAAVHHD
ncbi:ATP/GTP-binding protein [Streptomyces sp. MB09-01]|uniref:ATP/GTP-binding protein n=1 Tax=Streptomyces sp. MB09-01 TaxID=3028666 RepID=UPI0029B59DC5|nr:ATP/GTP-binding protein [Streptomyces sp. MB09-01]MDX3538061.1 ATP/GTP-binding protein [Streptomyces sp. MB09-01]